jgi:alanine racemase
MPHKPITWVEVSKQAIRHNIKQFQKVLSKKTALMAVVKSNAYGHGMVEVARIAVKAGVKWLGTVNLDEALELRRAGIKIRILVFSYFHPDKLVEAVKKNITLTVYNYSAAREISVIAKKLHKIAKVHFKVDTGTSRLGVRIDAAIVLVKKISSLPNIQIEGIFSHLADSENPDQKFTNQQIHVFEKLITKLEEQGIDIPVKHIACSAATLLNRRSHFNVVRIGISLYGLWSVEKDGARVRKLHKQFNLQPALSWHTTIVQVKELPIGTPIGYGCTYKTLKRTKLAIIPVGYWEGFDRRLSNCGEVLIQGQRCPVRGRICMNLTMVDVTHLKKVRPGERATLIGHDGKDEITADEMAKKIGTINYEIVTRINPLLPRLYLRN